MDAYSATPVHHRLPTCLPTRTLRRVESSGLHGEVRASHATALRLRTVHMYLPQPVASLLDFLNGQLVYSTSTFLNIKPLRTGGKGSEHAKRLADAVDKARQELNVIIVQGQAVPDQPVEGTGFQRLMITVLNDNRTGGLSAVHAEPGVGKSVATAMALRN